MHAISFIASLASRSLRASKILVHDMSAKENITIAKLVASALEGLAMPITALCLSKPFCKLSCNLSAQLPLVKAAVSSIASCQLGCHLASSFAPCMQSVSSTVFCQLGYSAKAQLNIQLMLAAEQHKSLQTELEAAAKVPVG